MKERMMKDKDLDTLRIFYLGIVAGSHMKEEIELDANGLAIFGDYAGLAGLLATDNETKAIQALASIVNTTMPEGDIDEATLALIKNDCLLRGIAKISRHVVNHGGSELTVNTDDMRTLHKLLSEYLEQSE